MTKEEFKIGAQVRRRHGAGRHGTLDPRLGNCGVITEVLSDGVRVDNHPATHDIANLILIKPVEDFEYC